MELLILNIKGISKVSTFNATRISVLTSHMSTGELLHIELQIPNVQIKQTFTL